jgi:hypothetical protein
VLLISGCNAVTLAFGIARSMWDKKNVDDGFHLVSNK